MSEQHLKTIKIRNDCDEKSVEGFAEGTVVNGDYVIVDEEPFFYDDAFLDSIDFDDIFSIEADEIYRELVMLDR